MLPLQGSRVFRIGHPRRDAKSRVSTVPGARTNLRPTTGCIPHKSRKIPKIRVLSSRTLTLPCVASGAELPHPGYHIPPQTNKIRHPTYAVTTINHETVIPETLKPKQIITSKHTGVIRDLPTSACDLPCSPPPKRCTRLCRTDIAAGNSYCGISRLADPG
ncbi:hypothetical protein CYPRO_1983 [Cyclonatronum proteinivorum]|uniref:Uncharacterized protein n=1 Tax=Cyclonatronum proteinivorum TaxID=1457365 RepID=A0A345UL81_9BACT|nr:hypothetical protein CYPRO_1983 [Cyclonatronum proteinivorum]